MAHLFKTFAHILAATILTLILGVGVHASGIIAGAVIAVVVGGVTTFIISLALNKARQVLNLMSAGRLIQIGLGLTTACLAFNGLAWLVPSQLTVTSGLAAAATMFVAFLVFSFFTGYINAYKGRPWLPKKFPANFPPKK